MRERERERERERDTHRETETERDREREREVKDINSGQLIFKYVLSKLFESKRLLKYDTYMES